jgi:hypothetical protein
MRVASLEGDQVAFEGVLSVKLSTVKPVTELSFVDGRVLFSKVRKERK